MSLDTLLATYPWHWFWDTEHGATTTAWVDRVAAFELRSDYFGAGSLALSATSPTGKTGYTLDGSTDFADPGMADWPTPPAELIAGLARWRMFAVTKLTAAVGEYMLTWAESDTHESYYAPTFPIPLVHGTKADASTYAATDIDDGALSVIEIVATTTHAAHTALRDGVSIRGAEVGTGEPGLFSTDWNFFSLFGWGADFCVGEGYFAALIADNALSAGDVTAIRSALATYYGVTL